jgi:hypothetical protein
VEETVATGVIQKWRLVLMMTSVEAVVMLMLMSVEAVVMLMMMSAEAVVMLMMMSVEAVVMLMMMSAEAVEVVVVVMAAATAYDTTRSADRRQTMNRLCARTPQAMLWRRKTCYLSHRWSGSTSCSNP